MIDWNALLTDWRVWTAAAVVALLALLHLSNFRPRKVDAEFRPAGAAADARARTLLVFMHGLGDASLLSRIYDLARLRRRTLISSS